jgi:hypothetical protein
MMRFIRPRLRKPVGIALAGTAYAAAWVVHGGNGWQVAIVAELGVIAFAVSFYVRAGVTATRMRWPVPALMSASS